MSDDWRFWWGTVTSESPLRVQRNGETIPLSITPISLEKVFVGETVLCQQRQGGQLIIVAKKPHSEPDLTYTVTSYKSNFTNANGVGDNPVFHKRNGVIQMRGRVRQTSGGSGGVAFTLPPEFRPIEDIPAIPLVSVNGGNTPSMLISMSIAKAGDVTIAKVNNATTPVWDANTWIILQHTYLANLL